MGYSCDRSQELVDAKDGMSVSHNLMNPYDNATMRNLEYYNDEESACCVYVSGLYLLSNKAVTAFPSMFVARTFPLVEFD